MLYKDKKLQLQSTSGWFTLSIVTAFDVTPARKLISHYEGLITRGHVVVRSWPVLQPCQLTHSVA